MNTINGQRQIVQTVKTVSVNGSDTDAVIWVNDTIWGLIERIAQPINRQVPLRFKVFGREYDVYICPRNVPGIYTMAALIASHIQMNVWDNERRNEYRNAKRGIEHLTGIERKHAKIEINKRFAELPHVQYTVVYKTQGGV